MLELFGEQPERFAPLVVPNPWIRQTSAPRALIFYYHRISAETGDPCLLNVSPENFTRQVEVFARELNCITLADLGQALARDRLLPRTAVITIDDGYADALHQACPILDNYGAAATIFITTNNTESSPIEFWWDQLQQAILAPAELPARISLSINGEEKEWKLENERSLSLEELEQHKNWNIHLPPPTGRHSLFLDLHTIFAKSTESDRQHLLDDLSRATGIPLVCRDSRRTLSCAELKQLAQHQNIELGAHTISHPVLSQLDNERQTEEIAGSKNRLEQATGTKVQTFAYPYGRRGDFTDRTVEIVRECGFTAACCTVADVAWKGSDPFRLPRIPMSNCSPAMLSDWLQLWF